MTLCGKDRLSQECVLCCYWPQSWGKPALEAQGPRLTSDCSRCMRERERKGGKAEVGRWFLKQPERGPGPTFTSKVGGTFVAWAFLERSCGVQDWGLSAIRGTRFVSAEPCSGVGKCGRRNSEQVSNELAQFPFLCLSLPSPSGRAGVSLNIPLGGSWGVHGSLCQGL